MNRSRTHRVRHRRHPAGQHPVVAGRGGRRSRRHPSTLRRIAHPRQAHAGVRSHRVRASSGNIAVSGSPARTANSPHFDSPWASSPTVASPPNRVARSRIEARPRPALPDTAAGPCGGSRPTPPHNRAVNARSTREQIRCRSDLLDGSPGRARSGHGGRSARELTHT